MDGSDANKNDYEGDDDGGGGGREESDIREKVTEWIGERREKLYRIFQVLEMQ